MRQFTVREMQHILTDNGYVLARKHSSHQIWKRDGETISLPIVTLKSVIALRLIKENRLVIYR